MSVPQVAIDAVTHYLRDKGCPRGPAIGMVSVFYAGESKLNPGSQGNQPTENGGSLNPHGAYAIMSLNGKRQDKLDTYAKSRGIDLRTIDSGTAINLELDFALTEMFNDYHESRDAYLAALPYDQFIPIFVKNYEVPADPTSEIERSIEFAKELDAVVPQINYIPSPISPIPPSPIPPSPIPPSPIPSLPPIIPTITLDPAVIAQLTPIIETILISVIKALVLSIR